MPSPVAANSRSQLSRILSNTGCASATELLMTCSTSAVAVCCSSASLVSLNRRAFWIAITAWSAKVFSSAMSFSENGPGVRAADEDRADAAPFPQQRRHDHRAGRDRRRAALHVRRHVGGIVDVRIVDDAALEDREARAGFGAERHREAALERRAVPASPCCATSRTRPSSPASVMPTCSAVEQALAAREDRLEHRLRVGSPSG